MRAVYEPLTQSVRELIDATIRTEVAAEAIAAVQAEIDAATAQLRAQQLEGSFGIRFGAHGSEMPWGNAVIGLRNPIAPPVVLIRAGDGPNSDTPIIVLSASARNEDHEAGMLAGADAYLNKPIDFRSLANLMAQVPGGRSALHQAAETVEELEAITWTKGEEK